MRPIIWSTADTCGVSALKSWRETIDQSLYALAIESTDERFQARLEQASLGAARLSKLVAGAQSVRRTPRDIARTRDRPKLDIIAVREGTFHHRQYGRDVVIKAGDCLLIDRSSPYRFEASSSCSMTLALEHDWLARWTPDPCSLAARPIDGRHGWGHALSTVLGTLEVDLIDHLAVPGATLADQIASLLVLACAPQLAAYRHNRGLEVRLKDLIADYAHNPGFDVGQAAQELGISKRSLHFHCARSGASFGARLMTERLDRAFNMLGDPRNRTLPIGEIAWRCGFLDQGHFAKRFRARFGDRPSTLRA